MPTAVLPYTKELGLTNMRIEKWLFIVICSLYSRSSIDIQWMVTKEYVLVMFHPQGKLSIFNLLPEELQGRIYSSQFWPGILSSKPHFFVGLSGLD